MKNNLEKELDKNRFAIVKYGLLILTFVIALILCSLMILKIDGEPILYMAMDYYFR